MHSVHFAGSMMKMPSPALIASFGHSGSQAEQFTQEAAISRAMAWSFSRVVEAPEIISRRLDLFLIFRC
jgi:hypothetical protein